MHHINIYTTEQFYCVSVYSRREYLLRQHLRKHIWRKSIRERGKPSFTTTIMFTQENLQI